MLDRSLAVNAPDIVMVLEFFVTTPGELHPLPGRLETSWSIDGQMVATVGDLSVEYQRLVDPSDGHWMKCTPCATGPDPTCHI